MANKICRITIFAFMHPDWGLTPKDGYGKSDLENGIEFCQEYLAEGYTYEYHDGFNLKKYIEWAKDRLGQGKF